MPITPEQQKELPGMAGIAALVSKVSRGAVPPPESNDELVTERVNDVNEIWAQIKEQGGVIPATLLNMHPWEILATGPHCEGISIPACPIGIDYERYVFRQWRRDHGDRSDGGYKVRAVWPIMLARDFKRQHEAWGGMVVYIGDYDPLTYLDSRNRHASDQDAREIANLIESERKTQSDWYMKLFEEAERAHATDRKLGWQIINVRHRQATRWLHHYGRIARLPDWVTSRRPVDFQQVTCKKCGKEVDPKGYACPACGRVHNPFEAFKDGAITKDDAAMKRCTREQLNSLGLKDVRTLEEDIAEDGQDPEAPRPAKKLPTDKK